jgi:TolB protein
MGMRAFVWMLLCGLAMPVYASLTIEISGAGERQIPMVLSPLAGEDKVAGALNRVIYDDLMRTGLFRFVEGKTTPHEPRAVVYADWAGTEAMALGSALRLPSGQIQVEFYLLDMVQQQELVAQMVTGNEDQIRALGHRLADLIYEKLTHDAGVFSTRIAYVTRQGRHNRLVVSDSDGFGEQTVLSLNEPIMSPAWSPDGSHLAYVSFEQGRAMVYVQSLLTNQRTAVAAFRGSNSAPTWSPDGKQLAVVLTRDGSSQIYLLRPDGSGLQRLTFSGAIDTEPSFSPDGQTLLFSSDRGGVPQIYRIPVTGGRAERLTFEAGMSFSPRFSPDGKSFVFVHRSSGKFYVVTQDFASHQTQFLTEGGWDKKPSYAPNGKLVLYATEAQGRGILATVSSDGRVKQKMLSQQGDIREPVWSGWLK